MVVNSADKKLLDYFMNEESYTIAHDYLNFEIDDDIFDMFKNTIIITNPYLNQFKNSLTNENKERFDSVCFHSAKNIISLSSEEHTIIQDNNIVSIFKLIPFNKLLDLLVYFLSNKNLALNMNRDSLMNILIEIVCYNIKPNLTELEILSNLLNDYNMGIPFIYNRIYLDKELKYISENIKVSNGFYFYQMFTYIDNYLSINKEMLKYLELNHEKISEDFYLILFDFDIKYQSIVIHRNQNKKTIIKLYDKLIKILVKQKYIGAELEIKLNVKLNKYKNKK